MLRHQKNPLHKNIRIATGAKMAISDDWLHLNAKFNKSWPICSKFSPLSKMEDLPVSATAPSRECA